MLLFFKITRGLVNIEPTIVPIARSTRHTMSANTAVTKYPLPKCKTSTFQRSFMVQTIRISNTLSDELNLSMNNVNDFKRALMCNYSTALQEIYDIDNPRTYKVSAQNVIHVATWKQHQLHAVLNY